MIYEKYSAIFMDFIPQLLWILLRNFYLFRSAIFIFFIPQFLGVEFCINWQSKYPHYFQKAFHLKRPLALGFLSFSVEENLVDASGAGAVDVNGHFVANHQAFFGGGVGFA